MNHRERAERFQTLEIPTSVVAVRLEEASPGSGERSAKAPRLAAPIGGSTLDVERAASCLLEPRAGDHALVAKVEGRAFVLAVLTRDGGSPARVELGGSVALEVDGSKLRVDGASEVEIGARDRISLASREARVAVESVSAAAKSVRVFGHTLETTFDHVRSFARVIDAIADDVTATMKRSLRFVRDLDQTRARTIDTRADGNITVHGENTVLTARKVAKVDSDQVHIG
ncbi:MAG: DUF3540 domain-containing protein [Polyangiaceae bacterium]